MNKMILFLLLTTIASTSAQGAPVDWNRQSVFIYGLSSNKVRTVAFAFPGKTKAGSFHFSLFTPVRANSPAQDGYLVGVAKGTEEIGISNISYYTENRLYSGPGYELELCGGRPTPVFRAEPGKIIYVTDIAFESRSVDASTDAMTGRYGFRQDIESARRWVEKHYPLESHRFVVAPETLVPVARKCHR